MNNKSTICILTNKTTGEKEKAYLLDVCKKYNLDYNKTYCKLYHHKSKPTEINDTYTAILECKQQIIRATKEIYDSEKTSFDIEQASSKIEVGKKYKFVTKRDDETIKREFICISKNQRFATFKNTEFGYCESHGYFDLESMDIERAG